MRPRLVYLVTAALAIASSLAVGCGSDEVESADSYLTCKAGTFRLEGTIDGTPVDITQPSDTGGFAQTDGGEFGSLDNTRDRSIGTDLKLTWERGIDHGDSTDATGTLLIRSGPFAGETFCLGDGTSVRSADDGQLQFNLRALAGGATCGEARTGLLRGCWK